MNQSFHIQFPEKISSQEILKVLDILHLSQLYDWLRYEPMKDMIRTISKVKLIATYLETLFCSITPVTILTSKRLLSIRLMTSRQDMGLQIALGGGNVDTLRTVPSFAAPGHLDVGHGVIILP